MTEKSKLLLLAQRVREQIVVLPLSDRPPVFENFPHGSCGWASLLLCAILKDHGIEGFEFVCGERPCGSQGRTLSHAWLERGSLAVDITADQFTDAPAPIIISANSKWHKTFQDVRRESLDFRESLSPGTYELLAVYSKVNNGLKRDGRR